jgi:uncharacterized protein YlzI (FlbEa/FlbD family)
MATLVRVHRDTGGDIVINLDHILWAEPHPAGCLITFINGNTLMIRESLHFLHTKTAP